MLISVIIPTCNRNDLLSKCLELLSPVNQTIADSYEVIVTDDSKDNRAKTLVEEKYDWANWISGPKKGPAANRNNGAWEAKGDWLIFIDDDCMPDKNILQEYKNAIGAYPEVFAFEGAILPDDWNLLKKDMSDCPVNTEGNCFWSANIGIDKALFKKIGGFDEDYLIAAQEDQQMKINIEKNISGKIIFLKQCVVIHPVRFIKLWSQIKKIPVASKNFIIYVKKNNDILNYGSQTQFASQQFRFHLKRTLQFVKSWKVKSLIVSVIWLFYGVPLNIINFNRIEKSTS